VTLKKSGKTKNKKKKKRKKPAAFTEEGEKDAVLKNVGVKSKGVDTKSNKSTKDVSSMSMDEFSAILAAQASLNEAKDGTQQTSAAAKLSSGPLPSLRGHLFLSAPFLDPSVELKRQFGAAAIKAYENEANSSAGRGASASASASARARAMAWNTNFKVRSILVQPQDTWPPIAKTFTGMTMETVEDDQRGKIGGWVHSR
jgi:hypothetical protein